MTKEPIMIDDIDISGCAFYIKSKNLEFNCKQTPQSYFCKNKPNCYYKQLKRLNNEYEGFAVKYTDMEMALKRKEEQLDQLKQTITEIKEIAELKQKQSVFVGETVFQQILQKCEVIKDE